MPAKQTRGWLLSQQVVVMNMIKSKPISFKTVLSAAAETVAVCCQLVILINCI